MENLAKKVVALESGKCLGYVLDVAIDFDKMAKIGYYVVDEETEGEYLLRFDGVQGISDVVLVSGVTALEFITARDKSLVGKEVLGGSGLSFGVVDKLVFEKKKLKKLCTDKCEIAVKLIESVKEDYVFLKEKRKKRRDLKPFQTLSVKPKVSVMQTLPKQSIPEKVNLSYNFFAGKLATLDVFGYNNERIISKNEKITKIIFENAKKHNKLNDLFFAVKK